MKNKFKKWLKIILLLGIFTLSLREISIGYSAQYDLVSAFFKTRNITVQPDAAAPSEISGGDMRKGLLFTAKNSGAVIETREPLSGEAELDFYIYEQSLAIRRAEFDFADCHSGNVITVVLENNDGIQAFSVKVKGETAFDSGKIATYTGRPAFTLRFDPNSMSISVSGTQLWSFSKLSNKDIDAGFTLKGFSQYNLKIRFTDTANGGNFLLYSFNGTAFSSKVFLKDTAAPSISAPVYCHAIAGEEYIIPKPYAYDVFEGPIASEDILVTVTGAGVSINKQPYQDGMSFAPQNGQKVTLVYEASDSAGNTGSLSYSLNVLAAKPDIEIIYEFPIEEGEYGTNAILNFPSATCRNELSYNRDISISVEIMKDGKKVDDCPTSFAGKSFNYMFAKAGEYTVIYTANLGQNSLSQQYTFIISDEIASFILENNLPAYTAVGTDFFIPKGTFYLKGESREAVCYITYPSGAVYKNNKIVLSEFGAYKLRYETAFDNQRFVEERQFTAYYPSESLFETNVFSSVKVAAHSNDGLAKGVSVVELKGSEGVRFNQLIDLSQNTIDDLLIELIVQPRQYGILDFRDLSIIFTDYADPSNRVEVNVIRSSGSNNRSPSSYVKASHSGYTLCGWEHENPNQANANNDKGLLQKGGIYGRMIRHSFGGIINAPNTSLTCTVQIFFDYQNKTLYTKNSSGNKVKIVELTDTVYAFPTAWEGFTDGKCYVTFRANNMFEGYAEYSDEYQWDISRQYLLRRR